MGIKPQQILFIYFYLRKELEGRGPGKQSKYRGNQETKTRKILNRKTRERKVYTKKTSNRQI